MVQRRDGTGSVDRRTLLGRCFGVAVATGLLAGCTDDVGEELPSNEHWPSAELRPDLPVHERSDRLESGIEEFSAVAIADVEGFVAELEGRDIAFETVYEVVELLHVEHVLPAPERRGTLPVAALVAGAYASLVHGGFPGRGLELVFLTGDGTTVGSLEIATEWAVAYNEGALSAAEYGELVASTIESKRTPPEHEVAPEE